MGHYVSVFTEDDGSLNYQDSFGKMNKCPLTDINRTIHTNKVKYQSIFANNCGYLALLHLYTQGHPLACKKSNDFSHFCLFKNTLYIILYRY